MDGHIPINQLRKLTKPYQKVAWLEALLLCGVWYEEQIICLELGEV